MFRTIPILALAVCSAAISAEAKPIFIKIFAPNGYASGSSSSYQSSATTSPVNTQLFSSVISTKIQLLNSVLQAKSTGGAFGFGFNKFVTFSSTSTTTEKPFTHYTTEVNTDFTPDYSSASTTHTIYTTTTEGAVETPKPTVHPRPPVSTSPTPVKSTTEEAEISTTTRASSGYSYQTPTPSPVT
ncbi:hypothetical protein KR009_009106, partial [Drosophila setifemur]